MLSVRFKEGLPFRLIKGGLIVIVWSVAALLLFALVVSFTGASQGVIRGISIFIKTVAVVLCSYAVSDGSKGLIKGVLSFAVAFFAVELIFFFFSGSFLGSNFLFDLLTALIFGIICSIIFANLKNRGKSS